MMLFPHKHQQTIGYKEEMQKSYGIKSEGTLNFMNKNNIFVNITYESV